MSCSCDVNKKHFLAHLSVRILLNKHALRHCWTAFNLGSVNTKVQSLINYFSATVLSGLVCSREIYLQCTFSSYPVFVYSWHSFPLRLTKTWQLSRWGATGCTEGRIQIPFNTTLLSHYLTFKYTSKHIIQKLCKTIKINSPVCSFLFCFPIRARTSQPSSNDNCSDTKSIFLCYTSWLTKRRQSLCIKVNDLLSIKSKLNFFHLRMFSSWLFEYENFKQATRWAHFKLNSELN